MRKLRFEELNSWLKMCSSLPFIEIAGIFLNIDSVRKIT
jgi:hypothetical protein